MSDGLNVVYDARGFENKIKDLQARLDKMNTLLDLVGIYMVRSVQKIFMGGGGELAWPPSRSAQMAGRNPLRHHNNLMKSIVYETGTDSVKIGMMPTAAKYGTVLHYGGRFTSKGKMFTIPLNEKAADIREKVKSLREVPKLFFRRGAKNAILYKQISKDKIEPWYVCKREISIPPFPFMYLQKKNVDHIKRMTKNYMVSGGESING